MNSAKYPKTLYIPLPPILALFITNLQTNL